MADEMHTPENWGEDDTREDAWDKFFAINPEVVASWRCAHERWPMGHPNDDAGRLYMERVTKDRSLTPEDEAILSEMLGKD